MVVRKSLLVECCTTVSTGKIYGTRLIFHSAVTFEYIQVWRLTLNEKKPDWNVLGWIAENVFLMNQMNWIWKLITELDATSAIKKAHPCLVLSGESA